MTFRYNLYDKISLMKVTLYSKGERILQMWLKSYVSWFELAKKGNCHRKTLKSEGLPYWPCRGNIHIWKPMENHVEGSWAWPQNHTDASSQRCFRTSASPATGILIPPTNQMTSSQLFSNWASRGEYRPGQLLDCSHRRPQADNSAQASPEMRATG